jgi:hypothetical protein
MVVATPAGRILLIGDGAWIANDGWKAWQALSPEERRKELSIDAFGDHDPSYDLEAPEGTTVVKLYIRRLIRDKGQLRLPETCDLMGVRDGKYTMVDQQPQRDYMWITREEVQALVPTDVKKGDSYPLPESIARRILTYHLPYAST